MNNEIKEILIKDFNEILVKEFCTDWKEKRLYIELLVNSTPFSNLLDYITNLQEKVEQYENPDDLTLFYMWLDEKAKDKMKKLQELKAKLEMYENGVYFSSENDKLQERIEYLERSNNRREDTIMGLRDEILEYEDYKSRNEKAIEYIRKQTYDEDTGNYLGYPDLIDDEHLLNILQGSEKE